MDSGDSYVKRSLLKKTTLPPLHTLLYLNTYNF